MYIYVYISRTTVNRKIYGREMNRKLTVSHDHTNMEQINGELR